MPLRFANRLWEVREGFGGPGPNHFDPRNIRSAPGGLALDLTFREGRWTGAEMTSREKLGFGAYLFEIETEIGDWDPQVVLGLFNYPTSDVGKDGTCEIDIEFARWGAATNPPGNYTVWPVTAKENTSHSFPVEKGRARTTHRWTWSPEQIAFESRYADGRLLHAWTFRPPDTAARIARQPMPVHVNLWLFQGKPPADGRPVRVLLRRFLHTPRH